MANFGLTHMTVVAPYGPPWREARSAVGAPQLLENARETATVAEAVADCELVIGTGCLTYRKPEQKILPLPELGPSLWPVLRKGGRVALLLGPEKHGLTRDDLSWCQIFTVIPTHPMQPSMNLGQAAAVCLYEMFGRPAIESVPLAAEGGALPAASEQLERLAELIEESMQLAGYSPAAMRPANQYDLRLLLRRLMPGQQDTRRMLGLFRRILWKLRRSGSAAE